jgi:hypothetical protein
MMVERRKEKEKNDGSNDEKRILSILRRKTITSLLFLHTNKNENSILIDRMDV